MITSDFHMHTNFSIDSPASPREMIEGALAKGLKTICITDHEDKDYPVHEDTIDLQSDFDIDKYMKELTVLKEVYQNKIDIRIGLEIGLQPHLGKYYHDLISRYPFDFVIGSVHVIKGDDPYYRGMFQHQTDEEVYRTTFEETLKDLDAIPDFDVLGHIDYVVRYGNNRERDYSYQKFAAEIDQILKKLIEMGKGIEINTSGFKYDLPFCHPHPDVIKRFVELGGEIITIGSDGHIPEHLAYDFHKVSDLLKQSGVKYFTEFKQRKPYFCELP